MKRLILVGSPRTEGRSAALANLLFETNIEECPEDELFLVPISEIEVAPCIGCDGCRELSEVILRDDNGNEISVERHRCIFDDDMQTVYDLVDDVDEVIAVVPVYFSGCPAPFKCLLDRLQPYFWSDVRTQPKRPATLHVVGEGGDPHGHDALISEVRSALAVVGFALERVLDWVGCIDEQGDITKEAQVQEFDGAALAFGENASASVQDPSDSIQDVSASIRDSSASTRNASVTARNAHASSERSSGKSRPKLDLSANANKRGQSNGRTSGRGDSDKSASGKNSSHKNASVRTNSSKSKGGSRKKDASNKSASDKGGKNRSGGKSAKSSPNGKGHSSNKSGKNRSQRNRRG